MRNSTSNLLKNILQSAKTQPDSVQLNHEVELLKLDNSKELLRFIYQHGPNLETMIRGKISFRLNPTLLHIYKHVMKLYQHHGSLFVVKYLKASGMALQRFLGGSPMTTLRELDPALPFPQMAGFLPPIIPKGDRNKILSGDVSTIRFWTT